MDAKLNIFWWDVDQRSHDGFGFFGFSDSQLLFCVGWCKFSATFESGGGNRYYMEIRNQLADSFTGGFWLLWKVMLLAIPSDCMKETPLANVVEDTRCRHQSACILIYSPKLRIPLKWLYGLIHCSLRNHYILTIFNLKAWWERFYEVYPEEKWSDLFKGFNSKGPIRVGCLITILSWLHKK